jgi:uncharacterized membrane protein
MGSMKNSRLLLVSAVAGVLAVGSLAGPAGAAEGEKAEKVKCYGANACKGQGGCAGAKNTCAGHNGCKGQGFVEVDSQEACLKMAGGRLTPEK